MISAPDPEDGDEASLESRPETPGPSQGGVEPGENALGEETPNKDNEILAPTDDLSPHDPVETQPTLDHIVKDVLAEIPQADGEEPGEANELVEDAAGNKGKIKHKKISKSKRKYIYIYIYITVDSPIYSSGIDNYFLMKGRLLNRLNM